ncbi:DNA helicase MCM9-like [Amphibalanus amphitrite]|uniref:DNA helicase MCM9-like n=1 Tax=Amphibalanus amphitrite TaxID=1232801 RepID=UPI001C91FE64|nr:DNA helicase MCM9-like [Amphibalanus amphitrite]XP_043192845.1 DNA helicase MCM9-like [Amphibalanus amphitrite]
MERKVNLKEVRDQFYHYALNEHETDIRAALEDRGDPARHIPIYVNFLTLSESCAVLTSLLRTSGSQVLPALDLALTRAARHLYGRLTDDGVTGLTLKTRLHARLTELPVCAELQRTCVPRIEDEGRLLCVSGTVVRAGLPHLLDSRAHYTCNKCKHQFIVWAEYEQSYQTERPVRCPNPQPCRAGAGFSPSAAPDAAPRDGQARDYQEIRLQEQVQKLDVGKVPRGLCVVLEDDLVDSCKAGDDVLITGTVRQRWRSVVRGAPPDIELTLHANRVFVNSEQRGSLLLTDQRRLQFDEFWRRHRHDPLAGRNRILQRFCSQIYGMYVVKLAVALTLVGGVRRGDGTTATRGEPHLLLVGDPGTGKSQLLQYAARLVPRSVLTTGIGSTSAGLTCAAVKEGPEWQLEAGALVLADGGVCCIDEFNSVREADKTSIHEAMEQQTISVAKAGMVCKLNTRCSIVAAANPRQPVDWEADGDVLSRLGLGSPLLSRFDLILVLKDGRSPGWDKLVSGYILSGLDPLSGGAADTGDPSLETADWSLETLQAYLAHVRTLQPQPDSDAVTVLQTYYQRLRSQQAVGRSRTTVRLLESLLRLTQAHARLRCSTDGARLCDAVVAVTLMEASLGGLGGGLLGADGVGSILHTGFPDSPADEYRAQCELILGRLGLDDLLSAELAALDEQRWSDAAEEVPADEPGGQQQQNQRQRHQMQQHQQQQQTQRGAPQNGDVRCPEGRSSPDRSQSRRLGQEPAADTTPRADATGITNSRSRFASLKARAAACMTNPDSAPATAEPLDSVRRIRPAEPADPQPRATEPADSLTRLRSATDRTPPEPVDDRRPALQLDRFKFVRARPSTERRAVSAGSRSPVKKTCYRAAALHGDKTTDSSNRIAPMESDDLDDFSLSDRPSGPPGGAESGGARLVSEGVCDRLIADGDAGGRVSSEGAGGGRPSSVSVARGRGARSSRPAQTRTAPDQTSPPSGTAGSGTASSAEPSRRTLSAATLSKLARFSAAPAAAPPAQGPGAACGGGERTPAADRTTLPAPSETAAPVCAGGQSQFESADDALCDLDLDFSWPPSKRSRS